MKIKMAQSSGFCMGVRRAMEMALDAVHRRLGPIYSYGPLIHNPQAMDLLAAKGLKATEARTGEYDRIAEGTVIIRAHGVPPAERRYLETRGFQIIDATCPRVVRVQTIIRRHTEEGYAAIIWGSPDHPEVVGLLGHAAGRGYVVRDAEDVAGLPELDRVILVAQTTQNKSRFDQVAGAVRARWPGALVFDTICEATESRQEDARGLAREVQALVVVGGHASGNTQRLAAVARAEGVRTIHIETEAELDPEFLAGVESVGVTAGASTPNWMIKRVIRGLERLARRSDTSWRGRIHRLLRASILSNVYGALGAGALCLAGAMLQGLEPKPEYLAVTFFYVHAMHMLNNFLDKEASQFNDPDRALFLDKHKTLLLSSGLFSAAVSLILGLSLGWKVLLLLLVMTTLGLLYAVPLVPRAWPTRIKRLKDIPSSKTLSLAGGWSVTLSLLPALSPEGRLTSATVLVALIVFLLVFIRAALEDIMAIQGDRIVGRETIPIIIGEEKTLWMLTVTTGLEAALLAAGHIAGLFTSLALFLLACAAYSFLYLHLFQRRQFYSSVFFEAFIDANFLLAGLLAWLWAWLFKG
ncbi:MAG: 4-hydroxy-3-methylbut-2-enyl diphosphate reductase [Thermodesulfobacteriota bacterium]